MLNDDLNTNQLEIYNSIVMAINFRNHWQLMVVWPKVKTISFIDPIFESNQTLISVKECWRLGITFDNNKN